MLYFSIALLKFVWHRLGLGPNIETILPETIQLNFHIPDPVWSSATRTPHIRHRRRHDAQERRPAHPHQEQSVLRHLQIIPVHQDPGQCCKQITCCQRQAPRWLRSLAVGCQLAQEQNGDRKRQLSDVIYFVQLLEHVFVVKPVNNVRRRVERRSDDANVSPDDLRPSHARGCQRNFGGIRSARRRVNGYRTSRRRRNAGPHAHFRRLEQRKFWSVKSIFWPSHGAL